MTTTAIVAQGTTFYIGVSGGTSKNISAITKANPAVVTTSGAHSLSDGAIVKFSSAAGMTQINGRVAVVDVVTTSQFRAYGINSSAFTSYSGSGTVINNKFQINNVLTFQRGGAQKAQIDVTDLNSTSKEFLGGLQDQGTFTLGGKFKASDDGQEALRASYAFSGQSVPLKITYSDASYDSFNAEVISFDVSGGVDQAVDFNASLRITGDVTTTP